MESYFDGYLPVAAGVRAAVRYEKETFFMSDTPNEKKFMREKAAFHSHSWRLEEFPIQLRIH